MNRQAADAATILRLPLSSYRGLNPFALDLVQRKESAARFLPSAGIDTLRPALRSRDAALAEALRRSNTGWGNEVSRVLDRWQRGETLTLIAGQQVCFAGGPLLVITKIASLLNLRERLARTGRPATVFFWLATEDHDFDEVATLTIPTRHGRIRIRGRDDRVDPRQMVGEVAVPEELKQQLTSALEAPEAHWLREGITFRDSFAELIAEVFRGWDVVLVDAMLPELRKAGGRLLHAIAADPSAAEAKLTARSEELTRAGYSPQIAPTRGHYSLLYEVTGEGIRQPVEGPTDVPPERLSTGAAARPLLQDEVFGTDVFVGGPSEVAYYAQVAALHAHYEVSLPHVALRAHVLAAPQRVLGAFDRYGLQARDLFESPTRIVARLDPEVADRMRQAVTEAEDRVETELQVLRDRILEADPGVRRGLERRLARIRYHFGRIEEQAGHAAARADADRFRSIGKLVETLAPAGEPQDRSTSWLPLWMLYGTRLIDTLVEAAEPDSDTLTILGL